MYKKNVFIFLFVFICLNLFPLDMLLHIQDGELDIPLEGVKIIIPDININLVSDSDGNAFLQIPEDASFPLHIFCATPGYSESHIIISSKSEVLKNKSFIITLGIDTVLEGDELVVEASRPGKSDEKPGVSIVRTSEELKTTSQIGVVEDVMSSVALLPGVGFKLGMNMEPSIRGGYPKEMGVTFDGVYLLEPFYWDGLFSILSPYMVDTVKLSTGIFSSKYGQGTSGLLDTTSVEIGDARKLTLNISTVSSDIAAELPLGKANDLFFYAHLTELTAVKWFNYYLCSFLVEILPPEIRGAVSPMIPLLLASKYMPHIYTTYAKWNYTPVPEFTLSMNALFAYDGISFGASFSDPNRSLTDPNNYGFLSKYPPYITIYELNTHNFQGLGSLKTQWLVKPNLQLNSLVSYNFYSKNTNNHLYDFTAIFDYEIVYDEDGNMLRDADGYVVHNENHTYFHDDIVTKISDTEHQVHAKITTDFLLNDESFITCGVEELFAFSQLNSYKLHTVSYEYLKPDDDTYSYAQGPSIINSFIVPGNKLLNSSTFVLWDFGNDSSLLEGEIGIRGEHYYLWNKTDTIQLTNYPVINPRANIIATPFRNRGMIDSLSFSAGSGLYSSLSKNVVNIQKEFITDTFSLVPDTAWTSVLGTDISFNSGVKIKLEGYYKHYLSRTYMYADKRDSENIQYYTLTDGKGYAAGADLMIEKNLNGWLDGYLTYSFLYARYKNPVTAQYESQTTISGAPNTGARVPGSGDPLGIWYYPEFHRFHTINAVLNFRLPKDACITISGSFATGSLRKQYIDKSEEYIAGTFYDPGLNENLFLVLYSDTLRSLPDWPVDIRFSKKGTFKNKDHTWEWYVGVENLLGLPAALYKIEKIRSEGGFYNDSVWQIGEGLLTIDMGFFPIPSIGVKMQF